MKKVIAFLVMVCAAQTQQKQWSMGYWCAIFGSPVLPIASIQWNGLTHIAHAFALPNADGTLDTATWQVASHSAALVAAAHAHNVKALLSMQQSGTNFNQAVESHLATFVTNIMSVVTTYGYDGVDLDWEPFDPATSDAADMTALAAALRTALGSNLLTTTANTWPYPWAYFASNHSYFDRINIMSYGQAGTWNGTGLWYNAAIFCGGSDSVYNCQDSYRSSMVGAGVPAAKVGLGVPFYGMQWTGGVLNSDHAQGISGPRQAWQSGHAPTPVDYSTAMDYNNIAPLITGANYHWDPVAVTPYINYLGATPADYWYLTYDDPQAVAATVQYVTARNLGGWLIWELSEDYMGSAPYHPLLDAVALSLASGAGAGAHPAGMAMSAGGLH